MREYMYVGRHESEDDQTHTTHTIRVAASSQPRDRPDRPDMHCTRDSVQTRAERQRDTIQINGWRY